MTETPNSTVSITLNINGVEHAVRVEPRRTLADIFVEHVFLYVLWIAQQRVSLPVGVLGVHAIMIVLLLLLFCRRLTLFSVFRFLK